MCEDLRSEVLLCFLFNYSDGLCSEFISYEKRELGLSVLRRIDCLVYRPPSTGLPKNPLVRSTGEG
jgi:hypothetical protein